MSELPEIALTQEEIDRLLSNCNGRALLVGGQALAFWAQHYQIRPQGVLSYGITRDADFVGSAAVAREIFESLRPLGWRFWGVSFDDATSQTAKLSRRVEGEGIKQVDFLSGIVGLSTEGILRRAVTMKLTDGARLLVLHPLDVLESRLKNIASLPSKRDHQGIAQARLATEVVGAYLEQLIRAGETRVLLNSIERIVQIAQQKSLDPVFYNYDLDPLQAVPAERIPMAEFQSRRWPQVKELIKKQRIAYAQRREGVAEREGDLPAL
jgi:hypothetical protein